MTDFSIIHYKQPKALAELKAKTNELQNIVETIGNENSELRQAVDDAFNKGKQLESQVAASFTEIEELASGTELQLSKAFAEFHAVSNSVTQEINRLTSISNGHYYEQNIYLPGSSDIFYPLWWVFPKKGVSTVTITGSKFLLELEGNGAVWSGEGRFMEIKRYIEKRKQSVTHVYHGLYRKRRSVDGSPLRFEGDHSTSYSGLYLRGDCGYRITTNWNIDLNRQKGYSPTMKTIIRTSGNTEYYVHPLTRTEVRPVVADALAYS